MPKLFQRLALFLFVVLVSIDVPAHSQTDQRLNAKLEAAIAAVHSKKSLQARIDAAEKLAALTHKAKAGSVSDTTVADLIHLLDDPEDGVRLFVAAALGNLKAKAAIPKLLALLPEADCMQGDLTSAAAIRPALQRMDAEPPPAPSYNDCHKTK